MSPFFGDLLARDKKPDPAIMLEAVEKVMGKISDEDLRKIAAMEKVDLLDLHFGLGTWIRNELDLWDNEELLKSCGTFCPDSACEMIIEEVWCRVKRRFCCTE